MHDDTGLGVLFRAAMRRMASTVSVVTCRDAEGAHGITVTAVSSLCMEPPSLLVCVNASSSFHRAVGSAGRFCVNMLASEQAELSRAFGGQRRGAERFAVGRWLEYADGQPYLADAQANLFCRTAQAVAYGTHTIFIGQVEQALVADAVSPLLYQDGRYARAQALAA